MHAVVEPANVPQQVPKIVTNALFHLNVLVELEFNLEVDRLQDKIVTFLRLLILKLLFRCRVLSDIFLIGVEEEVFCHSQWERTP